MTHWVREEHGSVTWVSADSCVFCRCVCDILTNHRVCESRGLAGCPGSWVFWWECVGDVFVTHWVRGHPGCESWVSVRCAGSWVCLMRVCWWYLDDSLSSWYSDDALSSCRICLCGVLLCCDAQVRECVWRECVGDVWMTCWVRGIQMTLRTHWVRDDLYLWVLCFDAQVRECLWIYTGLLQSRIHTCECLTILPSRIQYVVPRAKVKGLTMFALGATQSAFCAVYMCRWRVDSRRWLIEFVICWWLVEFVNVELICRWRVECVMCRWLSDSRRWLIEFVVCWWLVEFVNVEFICRWRVECVVCSWLNFIIYACIYICVSSTHVYVCSVI